MAKFANLKSTVKEMDFKVGCFCENVYANELVWQTIQKMVIKKVVQNVVVLLAYQYHKCSFAYT